VAPDGAAWVTDTGLNAMVRVDAETREIAVWPLAGPNANLNTATIDPDGVVWFTGQNGIVGRLDPTSTPPGTVLEPVAAPRGPGPYGIDVTPQGDVYFASLAGAIWGESFPGMATALPWKRSNHRRRGQGTRGSGPIPRGCSGPANGTRARSAATTPRPANGWSGASPAQRHRPTRFTSTSSDDVWLSDFGANALVRFDPDTETFVSVPLPDADARVRQMLGRPGEVWGAESGADALVVVRSTC
jgi:virginiamycin B lyase